MTLATRCTACGTAFRVVEDQLKVSDGWVRCGSCNGVFNASEHLFSLPEAPRSASDDSPVEASLDDAVGEASAPDDGAVDHAATGDTDEALLSVVESESESERPLALQAAGTEPEPEPEPEIMAQATDSGPQDPTSSESRDLESSSSPRDLEAGIAELPQDASAFHVEESEQVLDRETPAAAAAPSPSNQPIEGGADTEFASTVAVSGSSEFPASVSGFGASQPHSAFRESDAPPDSRIDAHLFKKSRRTPSKSLSERDRPDFSDARFDSDLMAYEDDGTAAGTTVSESPATDTENVEPVAAPAFLRGAERSARWQRPKVRVALAVGVVVLAISGLLQVAHHFRDIAAVRWPGLRPALAQWCGVAGCAIEPLRRIEAVSVESTSLAKAPGTEAFRLAVGLRNRGSVPIALPWIELSLTDGGGRLVARKSLSAAEFNPASPLIQPGADLVLQTLLSARGLPVTGYTVEVFYP